MTDTIAELVIDVRATTTGFSNDMAAMRSALDGNLLDGFERAGDVLERGLLSAIRKGRLGFDDLKRVAFRAIDQIAAQAIQSGLGSIFGGGSSAGKAIWLANAAQNSSSPPALDRSKPIRRNPAPPAMCALRSSSIAQEVRAPRAPCSVHLAKSPARFAALCKRLKGAKRHGILACVQTQRTILQLYSAL